MNEDFRLVSTLRVEARLCCLLSFHLDRFVAGAKALNFALDREGLEHALATAAFGYEQTSPAKVRVTVARNGSWTIESPQPLPLTDGPFFATLVPETVNSHDPFLPFSTTRRPIYDEALRRAGRLGMIDLLFRNEKGMVTEGANHSIFVRHRRWWRTPTLRAGVLPGVYRRHMLETMGNVLEEDFDGEELLDSDEIWLTNAVFGARRVSLVPVRSPLR